MKAVAILEEPTMRKFRRLDRNDRRFKIEQLGGYLEGRCCIMAVAFHRELGEQIIFLMNGDRFVHACTRVAGGRLRDARGIISLEQVHSPCFSLSPLFQMKEVSEEEVFAFTDNKSSKFDEQHIEWAIKRAQSAWPEWPWKNSFLKRVLAFLLELETVSKKHSVCIRGYSSKQRPVISGLDDDDVLRYTTDESEMGCFFSEVSEQNANAYLKDLEVLSIRHRLYLHGQIPAQPPVISRLDDDYSLKYSIRESLTGLHFFLERQ